ncbi:MAG TPA: GNAT family N-acetyltransferase [Parafilimonas sp.]|nr:GNAT family N-acetyltransferase [Parafilimonas sp.]
MAVIIDYEDRYQEDFRRLNLEWLERFNLVESHDLEVLNHPRDNVIDSGGFIFLLKDNNKVIGSAGILKVNHEEFELIKMYVSPEYRGKKYGEMLLHHCIAKAKQINASKIILYSNSKLQTAIRMYEKFGFKHVAPINTPFETADIKMEMVL